LNRIQVTEPYLSVCRYIEETLAKHGYEAWLVGGSVRDLLIEGKLSDLDYTTNALPEKVQKIFPRTVPVGIKFGTILVLHKGQKIEITTYRADADYEDGRRPNKVEYAKDLATDIKRRDFTVNGLAYSVLHNELKDHCGGLADLNNKILRTIGDPVARFTEDGLRPIRGCRIAAKLSFEIEPATQAAMRACVEVTAKVAPERFYDEWRKTLHLKHKRAFWQNLLEAGIVGAFLPDIASVFNKEHSAVLLRELDGLKLRSMASYAASLFYLLGLRDIETAKKTMLGTKFPTAELRLCLALVATPLLKMADEPDRQTLKNHLAEIPRRNRRTHMRFFLDMGAAALRTKGFNAEAIAAFHHSCSAHYISILRSREPLDIADLAVTGTDIQELGIAGRAVGEALEKLRVSVLIEPALNDRVRLLEWVKKEILT
jgi:tRNA nucleotidyltransferase (CCA-adding enzyme)